MVCHGFASCSPLKSLFEGPFPHSWHKVQVPDEGPVRPDTWGGPSFHGVPSDVPWPSREAEKKDVEEIVPKIPNEGPFFGDMFFHCFSVSVVFCGSQFGSVSFLCVSSFCFGFSASGVFCCAFISESLGSLLCFSYAFAFHRPCCFCCSFVLIQVFPAREGVVCIVFPAFFSNFGAGICQSSTCMVFAACEGLIWTVVFGAGTSPSYGACMCLQHVGSTV